MLYEKISGRSADPSKRMGAALAAQDQRNADRREAKDDPFARQKNYYMMKYAVSGIIAIVALIGLAIWRLVGH